MNSTQLRGFLTGLILGDGHIDKGITKRAFRIKSINYDFIDYIQNTLESCTNFKIIVNEHEGYVSNGTLHRPYKELYIKAHPYFNKKFHHFYDDNGGRRISSEALRWLNPEGLANWYMSDGYITLVGKTKGEIRDRRVELCTDRYSLEDVTKVKLYLERVYGYNIKVVDRKRGNQYRLRISLLDAQNFFNMISPFVVPSMQYKLNLNYIEQKKWMNDEYFNLMMRLQSAKIPDDQEYDIV